MNSVIPEVDFALRSLIEREAANGTEVEVVFDAPTKDWAGRRNVPTIDVYLYDNGANAAWSTSTTASAYGPGAFRRGTSNCPTW